MNELKIKIRAALVACYQDGCIVQHSSEQFIFLYEQEHHFFNNLLSTLSVAEKVVLFNDYLFQRTDVEIVEIMEFACSRNINPLREHMVSIADKFLADNLDAVEESRQANRIGDRSDIAYREMRDAGDA